MKPAAFQYARPRTLAEAVGLLARHPGEAKALSGGQSLMPVLNFRLATPALLVDLAGITGLDDIRITPTGTHLGARVRWVDIERHAGLQGAQPLLAAAIAHVAHYQIRNRGTIGGSLAHADPAAEMPGMAVALDARIHVIGSAGERVIPAGEFFTGALATVLADDELISGIDLPAWPAGRRWGFREFARRKGDFAMAGAAVWYDLDPAGRAIHAHVAVIGANDRPSRIPSAEACLEGQPVTERAISECARAVSAAVNPMNDVHASADYRRSLVGTMSERALRDALTR